MTALTDASERRVDDWLEDLEATYGDVESVQKTWELSDAEYESTRDRVQRGTNGGAGVWLARNDGAVLLVRNEGDDGWADPGGKREAGESFEEAARREVREEANVECRLHDVTDARVLELVHESDGDAPTLWSLIVIFAGEYVSGEPRPRDGEIAQVRWFDETPDDVLYPAVAERPIPFDP